ncbi:hypothetical protein IFM89_002682 [Coptis chinensis]|uniref:Uncharacterized protein n=1 Tax=Coptis chinensis TaxID=261450 RepID=A0A835IKH1_9MAGN|nr:hypothetical protein IFM89_002682 [Coptis chinensis]
MLNVWKVQQDPTVWSDPSEFRPETYLSGNSVISMDVKGQHFEIGTRSIQFCFDMATPLNSKVDMTETSSITNYKGTLLEVILTPRLNSRLYDN